MEERLPNTMRPRGTVTLEGIGLTVRPASPKPPSIRFPTQSEILKAMADETARVRLERGKPRVAAPLPPPPPPAVLLDPNEPPAAVVKRRPGRPRKNPLPT
jgi:hypothetical protein